MMYAVLPSFFGGLGWSMAMLQLSGFYCIVFVSMFRLKGPVRASGVEGVGGGGFVEAHRRTLRV